MCSTGSEAGYALITMAMHFRSAFLCAATALCVAGAPNAGKLEHFKDASETGRTAWAAEILSAKETRAGIMPEMGFWTVPKGYSYSIATGGILRSRFDEVETILITINRIREYVESLKFGGSIKSKANGKWSISLNIGIEKRNAMLFRSLLMGEESAPFTEVISGMLLSPRVDANVKFHF
jgi:hypothetical protein